MVIAAVFFLGFYFLGLGFFVFWLEVFCFLTGGTVKEKRRSKITCKIM